MRGSASNTRISALHIAALAYALKSCIRCKEKGKDIFHTVVYCLEDQRSFKGSSFYFDGGIS